MDKPGTFIKSTLLSKTRQEIDQKSLPFGWAFLIIEPILTIQTPIIANFRLFYVM